MFIVDFYNYLKKPVPALNLDQDRNLKQGIFLTGNGYITYIILVLCSFFILKIIDTVILKYFYNYSILFQSEINRQKLMSRFGDYVIIIVPFAAPFIEETLFRLPLNLKRTSMSLSVALIAYCLTGKPFSFDPHEMYSYVRIGIALSAFVLILLFFPVVWLEEIREKYFKLLFYISAVLFALVHISNFAPYNSKILFFYPLYTLPQFFMGLIIGYIRVKEGFFYGWALHALINLPAALLFYFK